MSFLPFLSTSEWLPIGPAPTSTPKVSLGFSAGRVEAAAPHPSNPDVMFIAGSNGGVWKTADWNNSTQPPTWIPLTDDERSLDFAGYHPLVVHPLNHNLVLGVVSGAGGGLLKSTNGGLGWQLLGNASFEGGSLGAIAVDPSKVNTFYVSARSGAAGGGVYKSTDGGLNWQNTTAFHVGGASDVIVAQFDAQVLYAGLIGSSNVFSTDGVYRSVDGGANWQLLSGLPSTFLAGTTALGSTVRLESAREKGTVYVSLFARDKSAKVTVERYKTVDGGDSWTKLAVTPGKPETRAWHMLLAVTPEQANHVFVNDAYAVYESSDGGKTWSGAESIGDDWVTMLFARNGNAVVTADRNVYRYEPRTKKWLAREGNLQITQFYDITLSQQDPDRVYGVAQDHLDAMQGQGSIGWDYLPKGGGEFGKVLIDPGNPDLLYVSDPLEVSKLIQRSTDGGKTWTTILGIGIVIQPGQEPPDFYPIAAATQKSFAMDATSPSHLLIGTTVVFETTDATSPQPVWVTSPLLSSAKSDKEKFITALAMAPSDGSVVYAATGDGHVWIPSSGGVPGKWMARDDGLYGLKAGMVVDLQIDPSDPKHAFAVTSRSGGKNVWHLRHVGAVNDWVDISGNLPKELSTASIFVDWQYATPALYVGTTRGVYHSTDLGNNWHKFGLFLPNTLVTDLQHLRSPSVLAAATFGRGAWEILIGASRIKGAVFEDADGDGIQGRSDPGMAGVTVLLAVDESRAVHPTDRTTSTDEEGRYDFENVPPGTYGIRQIVPAGRISAISAAAMRMSRPKPISPSQTSTPCLGSSPARRSARGMSSSATGKTNRSPTDTRHDLRAKQSRRWVRPSGEVASPLASDDRSALGNSCRMTPLDRRTGHRSPELDRRQAELVL
jgi:xyloglucan-specific exo-beta-1,4-glucanase